MPTIRRLRRALLVVLALSLLGLGAAEAAPRKQQSGPFFGAGNIPTMCAADMDPDSDDYWLRKGSSAKCHHMRTGLNGLDSPQVDVLIMVPVSPTAERDMRIMRQAIQMWEGGIDHLAGKIGLPWLAKGMDFHISVDTFDPSGQGGEFTTYPIVDPEIVVLATNPVGGIGIGVDPIAFGNEIADIFDLPSDAQGLCHGIPNTADIDAWKALPGFSSHHDSREGVYNEDCGGSGGNICFAVNGAIDPTPGATFEDVFPLFDLVAHEVGHCLTIGHVGNGAEGAWGGLPKNDIMAYERGLKGVAKCVSSLDVEGVATRMSGYLDTNRDRKVNKADQLLTNDQRGDGFDVFHVQRPQDHIYASRSGKAGDCPQPDLGLLPGKPTDWTP